MGVLLAFALVPGYVFYITSAFNTMRNSWVG
jgi:hypothetical protein